MKSKKGSKFKKNSGLFRNRRGIELQVNFLVIIIIALVIFGFGISLVTKMFSGAKEAQETLDKQAEEQILSYLNSGKVISMGVNRKEVNKGDAQTFALAMMNRYGEDIKFKIKVRDEFIAVDQNNEPLDISEVSDINMWTFEVRPANGEFDLKDNEKIATPILFSVPGRAEKGLYVFTLEVKYCTVSDTGCLNKEFDKWNLFNNEVQKVYIEVI